VNNALVPVTPINRDSDKQASDEQRPGAPYSAARPDCGFMAHLIATKAKAPQTRIRRRAEPGEAISAYAGLGQRPTAIGRILARSL
jgi:hypothetical protein